MRLPNRSAKVQVLQRPFLPQGCDREASASVIPWSPFRRDEALVDLALDHYQHALSQAGRGRAFIESRGLLSEEAIRTFRLGFADRTLGKRLRKLRSEEEEEIARGALQRAGLLKPSGHELFRGAVIFPFADRTGRITGGYGRLVTPKLKSGSHYHVHWLASDGPLIFNQEVLGQYDALIWCKSPLEALTWWVSGFTNVFSTLGYLRISAATLAAISVARPDTVFLAFGNTREERKAARHWAKELRGYEINCRQVVFPPNDDANSFYRASSNPVTGLAALLETAKPTRSSSRRHRRPDRG